MGACQVRAQIMQLLSRQGEGDPDVCVVRYQLAWSESVLPTPELHRYLL
jgi:hypothetical protein